MSIFKTLGSTYVEHLTGKNYIGCNASITDAATHRHASCTVATPPTPPEFNTNHIFQIMAAMWTVLRKEIMIKLKAELTFYGPINTPRNILNELEKVSMVVSGYTKQRLELTANSLKFVEDAAVK